MSDFMYRVVVGIGRPPFVISSSPVILHRDRVDVPGAYLLAPTHSSPYDVALLMKESWRHLDFMSITELYRNPFVAGLFNACNVFPLERSRPDPATIRIVLDRLARGRVVVMFPEGRFRTAADSVVNGGALSPGVARIARMAGVPVVPCCLINTGAYRRPGAWLPLRRTRFGMAFGKPLMPHRDLPDADADAALLEEMKRSYRELHAELSAAMAEARPPLLDRLVQRFTHGARPHATAGGER
jgi:1-acyl-sn-glycerol-3-phosphate acyltransferase